ncbi:MAG: hypothetical protein Q8R76_08820 [Candidatus Omnitrophota bacterium]|nr:hypothetical protein [Candidatus Omnitrophota bacterium]
MPQALQELLPEVPRDEFASAAGRLAKDVGLETLNDTLVRSMTILADRLAAELTERRTLTKELATIYDNVQLILPVLKRLASDLAQTPAESLILSGASIAVVLDENGNVKNLPINVPPARLAETLNTYANILSRITYVADEVPPILRAGVNTHTKRVSTASRIASRDAAVSLLGNADVPVSSNIW